MKHVYRISEDTGKWSTEEHIVIADSEDAALVIVNREARPGKQMTAKDCQDWGEVTDGWKGSISTGD